MVALLLSCCGCQFNSPRFYPIGIYSVTNTNDFPLVRAAGFNVITTTLDDEHVRAANAGGLRILASPGTSAGPTFSAARARAAIQSFDGNPAVWAWYLVDEPDLHRVSPDSIRAAQRFIKNIGATHPTALTLFQGSAALDYANIADITMIDRYPVPWLPLANFPQHIRMARLALGPKKPLMAVIQAFDWTAYPELLPGRTNLRAPTRAELRCMTYCALARQANGLFYYCYGDTRWQARANPDLWDSLTNVVAEVNARLPLFTAEHVWWPYDHDFADRAYAYNRALESSVTPALLRVRVANDSVPAGDYVLAVNTTERSHQYRFRPPEPGVKLLNVFEENRTCPIVRGWVEDEFAPLAVHIYGPLESKR